MGFSVSASTGIVIVGLFLAFGMFYPTMTNGLEAVSGAESDRTDRFLDQQNTEIELQNATKQDDGGGWTVTVTVTNTGATALSVETVDLLIDNQYMNTTTTAVEDNETTGLWLPSEALEIQATVDTEPARVTVVTDHGIRVSSTIDGGP